MTCLGPKRRLVAMHSTCSRKRILSSVGSSRSCGPSREHPSPSGPSTANPTKTTIRLLATREAAITEVVGVVRDVPELADLASRIEADTGVRRPLISRVEKMSRGVPPMSLNQGQGFRRRAPRRHARSRHGN